MSWERGTLISEKHRIEIGTMDAAIKLHFGAGLLTSCTMKGFSRGLRPTEERRTRIEMKGSSEPKMGAH